MRKLHYTDQTPLICWRSRINVTIMHTQQRLRPPPRGRNRHVDPNEYNNSVLNNCFSLNSTNAVVCSIAWNNEDWNGWRATDKTHSYTRR